MINYTFAGDHLVAGGSSLPYDTPIIKGSDYFYGPAPLSRENTFAVGALNKNDLKSIFSDRRDLERNLGFVNFDSFSFVESSCRCPLLSVTSIG